MRVYLDVYCYNRPFDDQGQDRIRLEAEAVIAILAHVEQGDWQLVGSEMISLEAERMRDSERRERVQKLASLAEAVITVGDTVVARARSLQRMGLHAFDALHVACAEKAEADAFLTTDDQITRWAKSHPGELRIRVDNPLRWLNEVTTP